MALLPVYLLQFSYGMNQGYPAILTPQLMECKDSFQVTEEEESWIGKELLTSEAYKDVGNKMQIVFTQLESSSVLQLRN